jgi:hypothetical protein
MVVCNGVSPYLGMRTMGAYEMYSGYLHIGGRSNHLLVPAMPAWKYNHAQRWVIVEESSDSLLQAYATRPILFLSFTRFAAAIVDALNAWEPPILPVGSRGFGKVENQRPGPQ